jgi:hypothetical protein
MARYDRKPFESGQHGNGGRNHAVPIDERGADQGHRDDERFLLRAPASKAFPAAEKRHQRHDPAFAVVIDPHGHADILNRRYDRQRPENEGEAAKHHSAISNLRACSAEHDFQGVERACADIAENDAKRR